jgi:hypothetical protein
MDKKVFVNSPIFPENYKVSNYGDVVNKKTKHKLKHQVNKDGYNYVRLCNKGKSKYMLIHRLVALAFVDNANPVQFDIVNHIDGVKTNNHFKNLEWCDVRHNTLHAYRLGLEKPVRGSQHGRSKYTEEQVITVCELLQNTSLTYLEISLKTGVPIRTVESIRGKENWTFISEKYNFSDRRLKRTCND